jgi:hypothetical protein
VGLHHSTIAKLIVDQEPEIQGNLGTRMCAITKFLDDNHGNEVVQKLQADRKLIGEPPGSPIKGIINVLISFQKQDGADPEHTAQLLDFAKVLLNRIIGQSG